MKQTMTFIRSLFFFLSCTLILTFTLNEPQLGDIVPRIVFGIAAALLSGVLLLLLEYVFKKFNLLNWNVAAVGLIFGSFMGYALTSAIAYGATLASSDVVGEVAAYGQLFLYIGCIYVGMALTARSADELHLSIPFVKFKPTSQKKKDIILDGSLLLDSRVIDVASTGLFNSHFILPRFILKELYQHSESSDEHTKSKARRSLEVVRKLESILNLDLRYYDGDFPEIKDTTAKLVRAARLLDANIFTADINRVQQSSIEGITVINIHSLSNALKPLSHSGESITIKIQRYGKEARQGVGYLDDGTMVVVNGGADFMLQTIKAQVLSVKHTPSGRMIFCNAVVEESDQPSSLLEDLQNHDDREIPSAPKNYFAL